MSADLVPENCLPPAKKLKLASSECSLDSPVDGPKLHKNGNGTTAMATNGASNGASNGTENGEAPAEIDESLYSRQLFVLGKSLTTKK